MWINLLGAFVTCWRHVGIKQQRPGCGILSNMSILSWTSRWWKDTPDLDSFRWSEPLCELNSFILSLPQSVLSRRSWWRRSRQEDELDTGVSSVIVTRCPQCLHVLPSARPSTSSQCVQFSEVLFWQEVFRQHCFTLQVKGHHSGCLWRGSHPLGALPSLVSDSFCFL